MAQNATGGALAAARKYIVADSMASLAALRPEEMAAGGTFWLSAVHSGVPLGMGYSWVASTAAVGLTPDGATILAPAGDADCSRHGCLVAQLGGNGVSPQMFGAYCRGRAADAAADTAGLRAALASALARGYRTVSTSGICALNGTVAINNFPKGEVITLGGAIEGAGFPAKPAWNAATPFFLFGGAGGEQVGIEFDLGYAHGLNADVWHIGSAGLGGSRLHVGYANAVNGVGKIIGNTTPVDVNVFSGNYWVGCVNPLTETCGNFGIVFQPGAAHAEANTVETAWIANFSYGGVIENTGSHFQAYRGSFESNGQWTAQICLSTIAGFAVGNTVTQGGATGVVQAVYPWRNGRSCMQVIETRNVQGGHSNFKTQGVLTSGAASAQVLEIVTVNERTDPESFDIISAHAANDNPQATVQSPYLGGMVGNALATNDIQGKNGSSFTTCLRGVGLHTTGGSVELANCAVDPRATILTASASGVRLGGYDARNPAAQTLSAQSVEAGNGNAAAPNFVIQGGLSNGSGCGDLVLQTTNGSAASGVQNKASPALVLKGCSHAANFAGAMTASSVNGMAFVGAPGAKVDFGAGGVVAYARPGQVTGSVTAENASAGNIGAYVSANANRGAGVVLASGVPATIVSITLGVGDWDVSAVVGYSGVPAAQIQGAISSAAGAVPAPPANGASLLATAQPGEANLMPFARLSLVRSTTVYLVIKAVFSGAASGYGFIGARRAR